VGANPTDGSGFLRHEDVSCDANETEEAMQIGSKELEVIEEIGEWDYDWTIGAAMRDEAGKLFFAVDSGCSCVGFGDGIDESDLVACDTLAETVEAAKACGQFGDEQVVNFADRLLFRQ
jgi:hypothetical protein